MLDIAPSVSIILVSYHTGDPLFAAIASVLRQPVALELIIVDNGNPPEITARLRGLATADNRIKCITGHGNIGFGRANNLGVTIARGEYVLVLNPDCILHDGTLAGLRRHAEVVPRPFMIGARIINEDGSDQRGCRRELLTPATALVEALHLGRLLPQYRLNLHHQPIPATLSPIPAISGAFMFLPRESYALIDGFDEGYFLHVEDLDFCLRFRRAGGEIYFAPDIPVTHIGGTSEVTSDFIEKHKARGFIRYFHHNFAKNFPLALLWCLDIAIWGRYLLRRFTHFLRPATK